MGLYEMPLSMSLLGFGMGTMLGNPIILRDLTQECRKKSLIGTDITV